MGVVYNVHRIHRTRSAFPGRTTANTRPCGREYECGSPKAQRSFRAFGRRRPSRQRGGAGECLSAITLIICDRQLSSSPLSPHIAHLVLNVHIVLTQRADKQNGARDCSLSGQTSLSLPRLARAADNPFLGPTIQYRTGKTLGSGTYAIVKEAVQIKTGKYYACKVINKKLMEGREYMVRLPPLTPIPPALAR